MLDKLHAWKVLVIALTAVGFAGGCGGAPTTTDPQFQAPTATAPSELKPDKELSRPPKLSSP